MGAGCGEDCNEKKTYDTHEQPRGRVAEQRDPWCTARREERFNWGMQLANLAFRGCLDVGAHSSATTEKLYALHWQHLRGMSGCRGPGVSVMKSSTN